MNNINSKNNFILINNLIIIQTYYDLYLLSK